MKNRIKIFGFIAIFTFLAGFESTAQTPATPRPFNDITAAELVANITVGWNLGNSLDTIGDNSSGFSWLGTYGNLTVSQMETAWSNPVTTKALIDAIKNAGFNAIRIPVTWVKAADPATWNIRADWMARVTEVVNYAVDNDMYIILNTHHDDHFFRYTNTEVASSLVRFRRFWEQIADNFKNYNEKLIFEALNEPRTAGVQHEWTGGIAQEHNNLNRHYQVFVDVVRASGGNNDKRILMINTYGAAPTSTAVNGLVLPTDTVPNKLIVSVHAYEPIYFCSPNQEWMGDLATSNWSRSNPADTKAVHDVLQPVYERFASRGIPVIIGEFGSAHKDNLQARADHAEYFVSHAASLGNIRVFWWDNGAASEFQIINRTTRQITHPQIVQALMRGAVR